MHDGGADGGADSGAKDRPTAAPAAHPASTTAGPTAEPTVVRTAEPMVVPRDRPTAAPAAHPASTTAEPTAARTAEPMAGLRDRPTAAPAVCQARTTAAQTAGPMAAQTEALSTQQPALARLIGIGVEEFARDYWGRQALLTPAGAAGGSGFGDLLDADAVDELVSERGSADALPPGGPERVDARRRERSPLRVASARRSVTRSATTSWSGCSPTARRWCCRLCTGCGHRW